METEAPLKSKRHYNCYLINEETTTINVRMPVYERLLRNRTNPAETFAATIDRIVERDKINLVVRYTQLPCENTSIDISKKARKRLKKLKQLYGMRSYSETIWRLL